MTAISLQMYSRPVSTRRAQLYLILYTIGILSTPHVSPQPTDGEIYVIEPTNIMTVDQVERQALPKRGKRCCCSPNCFKIWRTIGLISALVVFGLLLHFLSNYVFHLNKT